MRNYMLSMILAVSAVLLSSCGGGSGGGSAPDTGGGTQPTKATVKLFTSGTLPAGTWIGGIDITVSLAPGVSVKSSVLNPPEVDAGAVALSGVAPANSILMATYSAPTGTLPGMVRVLLANPPGFWPGEFATINGDIAAGSNPKAGDFKVTKFRATDVNGAAITVLAPGITAQFQ